MRTKIIKAIEELRQKLSKVKGNVGFVPTMGYLHEGHLSLVKTAKKESDFVVVSIFVNPSQFAPSEDLEDYPRDLERDLRLLSDLKVDLIFFPSEKEMYPPGYKTWVTVDKITQVLCGKSRPNHFRGVTTIVTKLMNLIDPDKMFMGEKDFQQLVVLRQMAKDLNFKTKIIGCPIIRESDGLAMSSRNKYLSEDNRKNALALHKSLLMAKKLFNNNITSTSEIIAKMTELIEDLNGTIDYIEVVDSATLEHLDNLKKGCRILLAIYIGNTRLIDNMEI